MCSLLQAKTTLSFFITVLTFIFSTHVDRCDSSIIYITEGAAVQLNFSYPCDVTKITLRHGYKAPFYNSADPQSNTLPPRYELVNHSKINNDDSCYLQLTINPVSRNDQGTYILTVYNNSQLLPKYPRIGLRVDYLPGKASCELSNDYHNDGEWVSLRCTALKGNLTEQIVCYQDEVRLPSLTSPEENDDILNQIILARLAGLVYCCTSTYQQTKGKCQCNDFRWDPIQNTELGKISDPCAAVKEMAEQDLTTAYTIYPNALDPQTVNNTCDANNCCYAFITTTCLMALGYIYFLYKARKEKKSSKKESIAGNEDEQHELQEQHKLYEQHKLHKQHKLQDLNGLHVLCTGAKLNSSRISMSDRI